MRDHRELLRGRRVLITGAARGIGAALAERLAERGARVGLIGLEPELLAGVAEATGGVWRECDVAQREQVDRAVSEVAEELGGLDIVVANAGIAGQLPILGGDPRVMEQTVAVNLLGSYYTMRAAGPHIAHPGGYALVVSSAAAVVQLPLLAAYSASKSGVEALGNTLRSELRPSGAKAGVAYFAELATDMTERGFSTEAAAVLGAEGSFSGVSPLAPAIDRIERGIARRSRVIVAPWWVAGILPIRMLAQPVVDRFAQRGLDEALRIARDERVDLTTPQPGQGS
ncbi:SDR family NAD(P)-dependent oxidoreductase [Aeromicrobium sp. YIM 150415]|uniref:SDR family NAD(P)-dependent oxidoreductase n=1 Tax=Aeromicrobium sp. YIM 150415 TaxID=2803912 RepID=UPI0019629A91|nr:SDR family NAD(P)-dependent oxidoreductase [Aeromicrobium sp. YIM 150415]MBM9464875.1 SDR family NAD(P)-dependent oxidoreductase [Aeromicrobium sp. YIM 150415]